MKKINQNRKCPACNGVTVKDYYREWWICTTPSCSECVLTEKDFKQKLIKEFWLNIIPFETGERKNESSNILLSESRAGARMESYVKLFENVLTE